MALGFKFPSRTFEELTTETISQACLETVTVRPSLSDGHCQTVMWQRLGRYFSIAEGGKRECVYVHQALVGQFQFRYYR